MADKGGPEDYCTLDAGHVERDKKDPEDDAVEPRAKHVDGLNEGTHAGYKLGSGNGEQSPEEGVPTGDLVVLLRTQVLIDEFLVEVYYTRGGQRVQCRGNTAPGSQEDHGNE